MSFESTLENIIAKHAEISEKLNSGNLPTDEMIAASKEISAMNEVVELAKEYKEVTANLADAEEMLSDPEMKELAEEEIQEAKEKIPELERRIKIALLPKDEADERNAIVEVRAGAGGDEAGLFAAELFRAYGRYAEKQNWKVEIMSVSESGIGSYKEASMTISGKNVFQYLKFESGVHRVQRVPKTESGGRVHTSTCTVAVLPEAEEVDIQIKDADLRIDVFRASGPGGQSVNTTDSAVRITHIPTGVVVSQQDEKSQIKNKAKAMKVLRSRLYEEDRRKKHEAYAAERKGQVGTGDRSERIRTYNFPQSRLTDHRINLSLGSLNQAMEGELDELINALLAEDEAAKLAAVS